MGDRWPQIGMWIKCEISGEMKPPQWGQNVDSVQKKGEMFHVEQ